MFNACDFSFNGENSSLYGLMLYEFGGNGQEDVAFGNKASIVESRTNNRIQPVHHGVNYNSSPLEFKLVFGGERPLDRFELERIAFWLTGHQDYGWLQINQPDMMHVQYKCIFTSLKPLSSGTEIYAFEATIKCDCPYAYGHPFERSYTINGETTITFRNDGTVREYLKPLLKYQTANGVSKVKIVNLNDSDREFSISSLPSSGITFTVDSNTGIIQEITSDYNLYGGFNKNFFRLVPGENKLVVTGDGTLTISGRFLHNVAG